MKVSDSLFLMALLSAVRGQQLTSSESVVKRQGEPVTLSCHVTGVPLTYLHWIRQSPASRYLVVPRGGGASAAGSEAPAGDNRGQQSRATIPFSSMSRFMYFRESKPKFLSPNSISTMAEITPTTSLVVEIPETSDA
ncbi:unnamed protein product [Boreogadus saida]